MSFLALVRVEQKKAPPFKNFSDSADTCDHDVDSGNY